MRSRFFAAEKRLAKPGPLPKFGVGLLAGTLPPFSG
jgi:hypothetical protein